MKISVLMSVCYKEKSEYLNASIDSIINQTLKPNQIVIIKDGKLSDDLEYVLNRYKKEYSGLIDIYEIEKSGLGNALAIGVEKCRFDYIARMDTDDIAPLYRLEEQIKIFKNNPELDVLGGYVEEYNETMENIICVKKVPLTLEKLKKYIKTQSPFNHGTVMMKKKAVLGVGNYSNIKLEDYDLWVRMLKNNCIMANTDLVLNKMRAGENLYKRRSGLNYIKKIIEMENKLLEYKIINKVEYIINIFIRIIIAIIPIRLKKIIYTNIIRKYNCK